MADSICFMLLVVLFSFLVFLIFFHLLGDLFSRFIEKTIIYKLFTDVLDGEIELFLSLLFSLIFSLIVFLEFGL